MGIRSRLKDLSKTIADLEKQFGRGAVMRLGDAKPEPVETFSTGSLTLDDALGIGGLPRGRIVEIYGPESSGKTTLTLHAIAEMQRSGGTAAFVDAEHALDISYAAAVGVDVGALILSQPDTGEQALEIVEALARSGNIDMIVVDSVAALTPRAEIEGQMGDSHVGLQARLMSQALRKLTAVTFRENVTIVFINQIRMKIGVMFGSPETTTGGNALKFYSSLRLDIRRTGSVKQGDRAIGNSVRVKVVKNKLAPPFRTAEFTLYFGQGIDRASEVIDLGVQHDIIEKSGAWLSWEGERLGQGREKARKCLLADPDRLERLTKAVRDKLAGQDPIGIEIAKSSTPSSLPGSDNATGASAIAGSAPAKAAA